MSKREAQPDHIQHRCPSKATSILHIQWQHHIQASIPKNAANRHLVPPFLPLPLVQTPKYTEGPNPNNKIQTPLIWPTNHSN